MSSLTFSDWTIIATLSTAITLVIVLALIFLDYRSHRTTTRPPSRGHVPDNPQSGDNPDTPTTKAASLLDSVTGSPFPTWRTDTQGNVIWSNAAYQTLAAGLKVKELSTPIIVATIPANDQSSKGRLSLVGSHPGQPLWFDVTSVKNGTDIMHYANNIDAVIGAEATQRNFVQTLAKTFAHLSTGLAIFNRDRQLVLFNPALVDLTSLPADFLSARPDLLSFFDRLRESRIMPEPKNYTSWRDHIAEVFSAASDGRFHETWALPSGLTFHVSGRPHPDGAVAFLIEDVSAEVSLTRRFRTQLELGQSVIDEQTDALAVFSDLGVLTLSNAAFVDMWGIDSDNSLSELTIVDTSRLWQQKCQPTPVWSDLRDFVASFGEREKWAANVALTDGTEIECHFSPLPSGATLAAFRKTPQHKHRLVPA